MDSFPVSFSYLDPISGVKIYRVTNMDWPVLMHMGNWGHDYAEAGNEVSLPYNGSTRAIHVYDWGTGPPGPNGQDLHYLIDFTPGGGFSNARPLTGSLAPRIDIAFTFSSNPATPYYAYVATNSGIRRIDIRGTPADPTTPIEAPGDGWPLLDETNAIWLHQSENDGLFVWMRGSNGPTIVGYEPSTGTRKTRSESGTVEPRIDRGGRYVQIAYGNNTVSVWDFQTDTLKGPWGMGQGGSDSEWGHAASLRRRAMSMNARISDQMAFSRLFTDLPSTETGLMDLAGPSVEMPHYANGNWIQPNAALDDQWALFSTYDGIDPTPTNPNTGQPAGWLCPGGMFYVTINIASHPDISGAKVLGAHYNTQTDYRWQAYPKQSPDGLYVMFTSDMNGSARTDVFLAELPTSAP